MKGFVRNNQYLSLCGLNCKLCPMNLAGHCSGCGVDNQSCKIAKCSIEHGCPGYGLPDKLGLAHVIVFQPLGEVGIFFFGHACLDYMASVGRIVSLSYGYQLLSLTAVLWAIF